MNDATPDHTPKAGMTNEEWAADLLDSLANITLHADRVKFLGHALGYACIYSERPHDRFTKDHVVKGHPIELREDTAPGFLNALCSHCGACVRVSQRDAALFCLACERLTAPGVKPDANPSTD